MKNIFKKLFTSKKKKKQQAIDASYVELDKVLKLKKAEHEAALAKKPTTKTVPIKVTKVTVTKTVDVAKSKPTAKKTTPKKK